MPRVDAWYHAPMAKNGSKKKNVFQKLLALELLKTHYFGLSITPLFNTLLGALALWAFIAYPTLFWTTLAWLLALSVIWAPVALMQMAIGAWRDYIRSAFILEQEKVLLEIKIPRHIYKTPRAMELVFSGLNIGPGETTFIKKWWDGKLRPWWSLELVSFEGKIHFYIWTQRKFVDFTMAQIYAQYPNVEIYEVDDYTSGVFFDPATMKVWGMEYEFAKSDAYPLKTYVDFELDKEAHKSEQVIDPLSEVFEKMSSLEKGTMMWVQFIIRQHKRNKLGPMFWTKGTNWKDEVQAEIEDIYRKATPDFNNILTGETEAGFAQLKPADIVKIKALERSIEKTAYDVGIRSVLLGKKDTFPGHKIPQYVVKLFNPFASGHLNELNPAPYWNVTLNYPWQDFRDRKDRKYSHGVLDAYKRRAMFYAPYDHERVILTTEELATLYHFPTEETRAPGLERITSTKGEPPKNLPV